MVILIVAVILALVFLTWTLCRAAAVGDSISERLSKSRSPKEEGLVCLGLLSPFLYAAAAVLPMAANLLRRLIRLIGGSR